MESPQEFGQQCETLAAQYLQNKGYEIVSRNFRTPIGETDLIVSRQQQLVFVEVRARRQSNFMHPLESIDAKKIARLRRSAEIFLQRRENRRFQKGYDIRFDFICVTGGSQQQIDHVENALLFS